MKRKLLDMAMRLSETDIAEMLRLKQDGEKKLAELKKERRQLATQVVKLDREIAALGGAEDGATEPAGKSRGRPKKDDDAKEAKPAATGGRRAGRSRGGAKGKGGLSHSIKLVMGNASAPMRAREIVDQLPTVGYKVKNEVAIRKRASIILASQKNHFKQVERGLYELA